MREPLFVKQNSERWNEIEHQPSKDPDVLAERFIQITDDLAYAKTFYPKSNTTQYLNGLAARLHQSIYKNKTEKSNRFAMFWVFELPVLFRIYRRQLLYALLFFIVFVAIGVLSAKYDDNFLRLILGDGYVDMTLANIAKGDPFGVYKGDHPFWMFLQIGSNNIFVSLVTYVAGLFFSAGTLYYMLRNGLMLGAFEYFFFSKGLGWSSILVIWIHGTIEISSLVIAGAAGLVLGNGLLFPKTYSRLESLKRNAKDSLKMVLGLVPLFVTAATLESFVTRHTEMPQWLSIGILAVSLVFMIWYVVIYPVKVYNKMLLDETKN